MVVVSHNEGANLRPTLENLLETSPPGTSFIVVDDVSTDGSTDFLCEDFHGVTLLRPPARLGAPAARNWGAAAATGDTLVFSDAHVNTRLGWLEKLDEVLDDPSVGMVAPVISGMTNPSARGFGRSFKDAQLNWQWLGKQQDAHYAVPLLSGCFVAMRRSVFEFAGRFDDGILIWGNECAELCLRLWALGMESHVVPEVDVAHLFRPSFPFEIKWELILHNTLRMGAIHFSQPRLERLVSAMSERRAFPAAMARVLDSDVGQKRDELNTRRKRDDQSFFERFKITVLDPAPPARAPSATMLPHARVVCVLEAAGERPSNAVAWFGRAVARHPSVRVLICPWTGLHIEGERPEMRGTAWEVRQGGTRRLEITEPLVPDVLVYKSTVGPPQVGDSPDERAALARWAAVGIKSPGNLNLLAAQILLLASERGVVTTANGWDGEWDAKDSFERLVAGYEESTGAMLRRMPTYCATREELADAAGRVTGDGLACILKPAEGTGGHGIEIAAPGDPIPDLGQSRYVVQPLLQSPLLLDGRKVDARCHVIVDVDRPDASALIDPVLLRQSVLRWIPGRLETEVVNSHLPAADGERPRIAPLDSMEGLGDSMRACIRQNIEARVAELIAAYSWWARTTKRNRPPNRLLLWGIDLLLEANGDCVNSYLSEVNVIPQLFREMPEADAATVEMLGGPYIEALVSKAASTSAVSVPAAKT